MAIDLGTPWLALSHSVKVPPDASHLPERFGLFTLILLGETVVAIMEGMESQEHWTLVAAGAAILSMGAAFTTWWWYFDVVDAAQERPMRSRGEAVRLHLWSYVHLPLYLGIAITGVGLQRIVRVADMSVPGTMELSILLFAAGLVVASMFSLTRMRPQAEPGRARARCQLHRHGPAVDPGVTSPWLTGGDSL
jgi:low temperature requirement protein LtrA